MPLFLYYIIAGYGDGGDGAGAGAGIVDAKGVYKIEDTQHTPRLTPRQHTPRALILFSLFLFVFRTLSAIRTNLSVTTAA